MTLRTQRDHIGRFERKAHVFADCDNVMNFKPNALAAAFVVAISAFLAGEVVACERLAPKSGPSSRIDNPPLSALPVSVERAYGENLSVLSFDQSFVPSNLAFFAGEPLSSEFGIFAKPAINLGPVVIGFMPRLVAHAFDGRMVALLESFVPPSGNSFDIRMVTPSVLGDAQSASFGFWAIQGKGLELDTASAFADDGDALFLGFGNTHNYSPVMLTHILANWKAYDNRVNCWDSLRAAGTTTWPVTASVKVQKASDWEISSQAAWEQVEGSTTKAWSPERTVKPHECAARKGRYSLNSAETSRSQDKELGDNNLNSVPFTEKLDNLSKHSVTEVINKVLKHDAKKTLDAAAFAQFDATPLVVAPTSGTSTNAVTLSTTGSTAITNNVAMGKDHVKAIVDLMKERNIPAYSGNDYFAIGRPSALRQLKNDLEGIHQYVDQGFTMIMNGEIGRYEGVRFVEQTNVSETAWTNGKSSKVFFFGDDTVAEAVAVPEEIRGKIPTDYGRSRGIAWYYVGGFGLVHSAAAQARIVEWGSAA